MKVQGFMKVHCTLSYILFLVLALLPGLQACAQTPEPKKEKVQYFGDCSNIAFADVDNSNMTVEEELALKDADFLSTLNKSEACMRKATNASAARVADAAGGSAGDGVAAGQSSGTTGQATNVSQPVEQTNSEQTNNTEQNSSTGKTGPRGNGQQSGSSAVCDAVKSGLKNATTDSEKAHFEGLMKDYNCK